MVAWEALELDQPWEREVVLQPVPAAIHYRCYEQDSQEATMKTD